MITSKELLKVQNKFEANFIYGQSSILNKAMNLGYYELLSDANMLEHEISKYRQIDEKAIMESSRSLFNRDNCSALIYHAEKK